MRRVRLADRCRCGFGESQVPHLPCLDELLHSPDGLLDGRLGVDTVQVIEVYVVDAEPLEGSVASLLYVLRFAAHASIGWVLATQEAELCGDNYLVLETFDRPADELLVGKRAVGVRGIQHGN